MNVIIALLDVIILIGAPLVTLMFVFMVVLDRSVGKPEIPFTGYLTATVCMVFLWRLWFNIFSQLL